MRPIHRLLPLLLLLWSALAVGEVEVPTVRDLHAEAAAAVARGVPLMLVFSGENCPYCMKLEAEVLKPMLIGHHYDDQVVVRKVMIDGFADLVGFDGEAVDPAEFARRHRVRLTPTVLFLDAAGRELAPRMAGINTVDYYWEALDKNLALAKGRLAARAGK